MVCIFCCLVFKVHVAPLHFVSFLCFGCFISILRFLVFVNNFFKKMVTHPRLERGTPWLKVRCSADWANGSYGAGEGDRTLATGLEGRGSTTELHPQIGILNFILVTPRGIEPLLPPWKGGVLTAWPRGHWNKSTWAEKSSSAFLNWLRPTFPGGCPPSIISDAGLNFCVRNGNRCISYSIIAIF